MRFRQRLADDITDVETLLSELRGVEERNTDALLCFNHGVMLGAYEPNSGHVAVFDRIVDEQIRLVDPSERQPKWRLVRPDLLLSAIQQHGNERSGGIWYLTLYQVNGPC